MSSLTQVVPIGDNEGKVGRQASTKELLDTMEPKLLKSYREAFDLVDKDRSGFIDKNEMTTVMKMKGLELSEEDVVQMISETRRANGKNMTDNPQVDFPEFCSLLKGAQFSNMNEMFQALADKKKSLLGRMHAAGQPLHKQMETHAAVNGLILSTGKSARLALAKRVDGSGAQWVIMTLIVLDVICVICEVVLLRVKCTPPGESHRRALLAAGGPRLLSTVNQTATPGFCLDCMDRFHAVENVFHWISVGILFVFAFQIFLLIIAYGIEFFKNKFFVLDMLVVAGALVLELAFHVSEGALFAVLLSWRFIRIVHGLVSTVEISHHKFSHGSAAISAKEHEKQKEMVESIFNKILAIDIMSNGAAEDSAALQSVKAQVDELVVFMQDLKSKTANQVHHDHAEHMHVLERKMSQFGENVADSLATVKREGQRLLV